MSVVTSWMFCCGYLSKTVLNFIAKNKTLLHNAIVDWLKEAITKTNHKRNVETLNFFKQQMMVGLIPSTCFPDIDLPVVIYLSIVDQHKERMYNWYNEVTNEDTMDP